MIAEEDQRLVDHPGGDSEIENDTTPLDDEEVSLIQHYLLTNYRSLARGGQS